MLNSGKEITEADKKEAKRRIQGSIAVEDSPDGSGDDIMAQRRLSRTITVNTLAASAM
jgi:phosphatidylserine decarboxylase